MNPVLRAMLSLCLLAGALAMSEFGGYKIGVVAALVALIIGVVLPVNRAPGRVLSLESIAMLTLAAYSMAVPIHHVLYIEYVSSYAVLAFQLCIFAAMGMVIGNLFYRLINGRRRKVTQDVDRWEWQKYYWIGWGIFALGVLSAFFAIALTVGFDAYLSAGYAGRAALKREAGPVELGLYHAVVGLTLVNLARLRSPDLRDSRTLFVLVCCISLLFIAYVSLLGIRRPSFFLALSMLMLYGVSGRGVKKIYLSLAAPMLLAFALFANFRQVLTSRGSRAAIQFVSENFSLRWFDLSRTELGATFRVLTDIFQTWDVESLRFGASYLIALPYVLPSMFGINVMSLSQEYTLRNFSSEFIAIGGNMGFFSVAEGYLNYGVPGVIVYFIAIGFVVSRVQDNALKRAAPLDLLVFAWAAPWFVFFIRSDLASFSKMFVYSVFAPYVLAYGIIYLWSRKRTSSRGVLRIEGT